MGKIILRVLSISVVIFFVHLSRAEAANVFKGDVCTCANGVTYQTGGMTQHYCDNLCKFGVDAEQSRVAPKKLLKPVAAVTAGPVQPNK